MALQIVDSCVNCWACVDVCPNDAIYEDVPHFLVDDRKCTECLGDHADPQCAAICPIDRPTPSAPAAGSDAVLTLLTPKLSLNGSQRV